MAQVRDSIPISNVSFDRVSMGDAVVRVLEMARRHDHPRHVCTANLDHLAMLDRDMEFRNVYKDADLVLADGMPVVWLSRLASRKPLPERVAGSDLFWELARASALTGVRLFYLGGLPGSAEGAAAAVQGRFPGVRVCGTYCPSFEEFGTEAEEDRIEAIVHAAEPDILLVGLGAPKQEKWIAATKHRLRVPVCIGVGGSFEMASGAVRRAPAWMQRIGMEWSYRLLQEPSRLWRRYLLRDLPTLVSLVWRTLCSRQFIAGRNASGG